MTNNIINLNNEHKLLQNINDTPENWFWVITLWVKKNVSSNIDNHSRILWKIIESLSNWNFQHNQFNIYFNNLDFLSKVNDYVEPRLKKILIESNIYTFDELSKFISILWMWKYSEIIIDLNSFNIEDLKKLTLEYINKLNSTNQKTEFDIIFKSYLMLINSINTLCILDQVNTYRKKLIPEIVSILRKSIETLMSNWEKLEFLDQNNINSLQYYLWLLWINFSHSDYYFKEKSWMDDITKEFLNISKRQKKWFNNCVESKFWNNPQKEKLINSVYIWNYSFSLSVLIYKIWENNYNELLRDNSFIEILKTLWNYYWEENYFLDKDIEFIKNFCNNIFSWIYYDEDFLKLDQKAHNPKNVIEDFCTEIKDKNDYVIESIHNLVLFNNLEEKTLYDLWNKLIEIEPYNNYSFEFYKLKILDLIVEKLKNSWDFNTLKKLYNWVLTYVENNKTASQLFYAYSSLYLSVSYCLSINSNIEFQNLSVNTFIKFLKFNENIKGVITKYDINEIYSNIWNSTIANILWNEKLELYNPTRSDLIKTWKEVVRKAMISYDTTLEVQIEKKLSIILEKALDHHDSIDDKYLLEQLSLVVSNEIFYWLSKINIIEKQDKYISRKDNNWSSYIKENLSDKHEIVFYYPSIYKEIFEEIHKAKIDYVKKVVNQIMNVYYNKNNLLYQDSLTWLFNESKLRLVLKNSKQKYSFINLKLTNLEEINSVYWRLEWDKYLKTLSSHFENLSVSLDNDFSIFRLSWSKFWFLIKDSSNIEEIISKIREYKVNINWKLLSVIWIFWIIKDQQDSILEKSSIALSCAKKNHDWIGDYSSVEEYEKEYKKSLDYLIALDEAIESNNVLTYFQPLKDLKTGEIYKYEALMRVKSWDKIDSPFYYLEAAKKYWRLSAIAKINIDNVFKILNDNPEKYFSLNLSWEDFIDINLSNYIIKKLQEYKNVDPSHVTFEILESEWTNYENIKSSIIRYKKIWFKIWIDDYWAESSNINRLNDLLNDWIPDFVKIDGWIIKELWSDDNKKMQSMIADIRNVLEKSNIYWFKVVAEFIENPQIELICKTLWIDFGQWYNIWKPNSNLDILK